MLQKAVTLPEEVKGHDALIPALDPRMIPDLPRDIEAMNFEDTRIGYFQQVTIQVSWLPPKGIVELILPCVQ